MLVLRQLPLWSLGESRDAVRTFVMVLIGIVALTLAAACANLANLLLAKGAARRRETGVRLALGATRGRVLQQALVESLALSIAGGLAGLACARGGLGLFAAYQLPGGIPVGALHLDLDARAILATSALSLLTGFVFGLLPAWRASRTDVMVSLRDASRTSTPRSFARSALLTVQVALSVVLLAGSGLFVRALLSALETHPGFDARGVVTASVNLGLARYEGGAAEGYYASALERVEALPDISSVAWTNLLPTRGLFRGVAEIEGYTPPSGESVTLYGSHVGPGYFATIGTRLLAGREFAPTDDGRAATVGVVNEVMAKTFWPGRSALGRRFQMFDEWITVVGVVEPTVVAELREAPRPQVYFAFDQWLTGRMGIALDTAHLVVRTSAPVERVLPLIRERLRSTDPAVPVYDAGPFETKVAALVMPQRMGAVLFTLFSALALALAVVGIYAVASYVAALRTREIGVRIALGATRAGVARMIVADGARPVAIGIATGLALALAASRTVESFLHGISRFDPLTFIGVPVALGIIALTATYLPARRASRVAPVDALRVE
jgi:predicted permease